MHAFFYGFYLLQLVAHGWADKDRGDGSGWGIRDQDWGETAPIKTRLITQWEQKEWGVPISPFPQIHFPIHPIHRLAHPMHANVSPSFSRHHKSHHGPKENYAQPKRGKKHQQQNNTIGAKLIGSSHRVLTVLYLRQMCANDGLADKKSKASSQGKLSHCFAFSFFPPLPCPCACTIVQKDDTCTTQPRPDQTKPAKKQSWLHSRYQQQNNNHHHHQPTSLLVVVRSFLFPSFFSSPLAICPFPSFLLSFVGPSIFFFLCLFHPFGHSFILFCSTHSDGWIKQPGWPNCLFLVLFSSSMGNAANNNQHPKKCVGAFA